MSNVKVEKQEPQGPSSPGAFEEWYDTKFKHGFERGPNDKYVARKAWFAALYTAPQPCPGCENLKAGGMVLVTKEDAENYCRVLTLLGMEEEGSPTEEVERLLSLHEGMVCADCQDTGWLENREEGKYPCTCMTEAEPYQLLEAERDELAAQVTHWKANHASVVEQARILKERPDMPIERVKAYENWVAIAAQNQQMLEAIENVKEEAWLCCSHQRASRLCEALALPNLATSTLNKVRAEALDAKRYRWLRSSSVGPAQIWELLSDDCNPPVMTLKSMGDLDAAIDSAMAADMGAGKCQVY